MSIIQNEINGLMADLHEIAIADPLPYFCPEAPGRALLEQMEAVGAGDHGRIDDKAGIDCSCPAASG